MPLLWYVINYPKEWLEAGKIGEQKIVQVHYLVHEALSRSQWTAASLEKNKSGNLHTQGSVMYKKKPQKVKLINRVLHCGKTNQLLPFEYMQMDWCNGTCLDNYNYIAHKGPHKDKGPLWDFLESGNKEDADVLLAQEKITQRGTRTDIIEFKKDVEKLGLRPAVFKNDSNAVTFAKYPVGMTKLSHMIYAQQREEIGFRQPDVIILWGPPNSDKSSRAFGYKPTERRYILPTVTQGQVPWMGKYENQPIVILNDFYGQMDFDHLMNFLDGYPFDCPNKGDFVPNSFHTVIFTSNSHPRLWYPTVPAVKICGFMRRIKLIHACLPVELPPMTWCDVKHSSDDFYSEDGLTRTNQKVSIESML